MAFDFDGIEDANIFERGKFLPKDGKFKLQVERMLVKKTRKSGPAFIAEFKVLETDHEDVPVGDKRSWFQKLTDKDVAFPAIQEFMGALLGFDRNNKEEWADFKKKLKPIINEAANYEGPAEKHPLHGMVISVTTWQKTTDNNKEFTVHDWEIVPEEDD